ncbi:MAG: DMT family transporter [Proteobacteria bacterium]|nr:DMT family transporter [Pseudomonadota bacterium]MBI3495911.1 DMT family transporter [Pseudomonadota bacterium]
MSIDEPPARASDRAGLRAIVYVLVTVTLFAFMNGTAKYLTQSYPVIQVLWGRFFFAMLVTLIYMYGPNFIGRLRTRRPALQFVRSCLMLGCTLMFITALSLMPLAEVEALNFTAPLFVTALSLPLLGETVDARRWIAVLAGFVGVLVIIRPGAGVMSWAALLPVCVALGYALYQITTRYVGNSDPALTSLFYAGLLGTVGFSAIVPFYWQTPSPVDWLLFGAVGTVGASSHLLMIKALALAPASVLQPFGYIELVWAVAIGWAVFGAIPDAYTVLGAIIIVASGFYVLSRQRERGAGDTPPRASP